MYNKTIILTGKVSLRVTVRICQYLRLFFMAKLFGRLTADGYLQWDPFSGYKKNCKIIGNFYIPQLHDKWNSLSALNRPDVVCLSNCLIHRPHLLLLSFQSCTIRMRSPDNTELCTNAQSLRQLFLWRVFPALSHLWHPKTAVFGNYLQ